MMSNRDGSGSAFGGGFNAIDKVFILWALLRAFATVAQFVEAQAIVNQVGFLWDAIGGYVLVRFLIRDEADARRAIKALAIIAIVLGVTMTYEKAYRLDVFGYLGGVPLVPAVRDGAVRAQGTLSHPILAGVFGATMLCLLLSLFKSGRSRLLASAGVLGCTAMTIASASSTPLMAYLAGIVAIATWPIRRNLRVVRWGIVFALVAAHLMMKAPVWFLIARVDTVAGNSGYHRAMLIDQFIRHFWDWWLIGVRATADWGWDMWDQTNQFVAEGEIGGLATLICFILLIVWSFSRIGRAAARAEGDRSQEWSLWFLGSALLSHVVGYFGISYFDQTRLSWYVLLGMISVMTAPLLAAEETDATVSSVTDAAVLLARTRQGTPPPAPLKHRMPFPTGPRVAGKASATSLANRR